MAQDFSIEKPEVSEALAETLGNAVVLYFKAHGHHWNVVGNDFSQFHDFFADIYEDIYSSFDALAENMRKLGAFAPYKLVEFAQLSSVKDANVGTNAMSMCKDLYDSNEIMIRSLDNCFAVADAANEQGIADFIAGRIDMHKKWRWQLNAFLTSESSGESEAVQPVEVETEEVFMDEQPVFAAGSLAKTPAPKKDRIKGSKTNKAGSASGTKSARKVKFSDKIEKSLKEKVSKHNESAPNGRKASLSMLKAVYRRGAGAFSTSHRPGMTRDQWAMGRVNAFLRLLKSGKPANSNYTTDNDLLPASHPRSSKKSNSAVTAGALLEENYDAELTVEIKDQEEYASIEEAILAMAEFSGFGYEIEPSLKAAWARGVKDNQNPFDRALDLAEYGYQSIDADLLPLKENVDHA